MFLPYYNNIAEIQVSLKEFWKKMEWSSGSRCTRERLCHNYCGGRSNVLSSWIVTRCTHVFISYTRSMTFAKIVLACAQWRVWWSLMEAGDKPRRLSIRTVVAIDGEMGIGYRGGMPWPFMKWVWSYNLRHPSHRLSATPPRLALRAHA